MAKSGGKQTQNIAGTKIQEKSTMCKMNNYLKLSFKNSFLYQHLLFKCIQPSTWVIIRKEGKLNTTRCLANV